MYTPRVLQSRPEGVQVSAGKMTFYTNPHSRSQISASRALLWLPPPSQRRRSACRPLVLALILALLRPLPPVEWYAKEIKLDYESVAIDMGSGEHKRMPFLSVNPFGKLPAVKARDTRTCATAFRPDDAPDAPLYRNWLLPAADSTVACARCCCCCTRRRPSASSSARATCCVRPQIRRRRTGHPSSSQGPSSFMLPTSTHRSRPLTVSRL